MATNDKKPTGWDKASVVALGGVVVSILVLAFSVFQFKDQQSTNAAQMLDQQRQTTLDGYLDAMSTLVLTYHLGATKSVRSTPPAIDPVRALAIARTDTAVRDLDGPRKGTLIRYLWEANLVRSPGPTVPLFQVNLRGAIFNGARLLNISLSADDLVKAHFIDAELDGADLSYSDLSGADLSGASLTGANLSRAYLTGANLTGANLTGANLSGAYLGGASVVGATYTVKRIQSLEPTRWPQGFQRLRG